MNERPFALSEMYDNHTVRVGSWSMTAELDPSRAAAMEIQSSDQKDSPRR